jgi:hypothetical protein
MWCEVPQPIATAVSPGAGSRPATAGAMSAAFRHRAGWLAISLVMACIYVNVRPDPSDSNRND